jgi:molecular chaperone DnaJ
VAARSRRDYYAVLGVPHGSDRDTIRRAFRSLAAEWHPDVSDDPEALDRFREIAEAYEVLSRPDTRERYDRYGFDPRGMGGFSTATGSASGMFDDLLDLAAAFKRAGGRGGDVAVEVHVEAADAEKGGRRGVRYTALTVCPACHGEGGAPGSARVACTDCGGRGRRRDGAERASRLELCGTCRGSGRVQAEPCGRCEGAGRFESERAVLVEVPSATTNGDVLRVVGEGNAGGRSAEPGDLLVTVHVGPERAARTLRLIAAATVACVVVVVVLVVVFLTLE